MEQSVGVNYRISKLIASLSIALSWWGYVIAPASAEGLPNLRGPAVVVTQNMDEGTDFGPVLTATSPTAIVSAVAATWQEVQASNIPERATAVAKELASIQPDLVGLQEVTQWYTGPLGQNATTLRFDALQSLLDALAQDGAHYAVAARTTDSDFQAPDYIDGVTLRVVDHDVILARSDLGTSLSITNAQNQNYSTFFTLTTAVGPVTILRGWASIDVTLRGHSFRFITTHLETAVAVPIQLGQVQELINGPAATALPVIMAGDFNSAAAGGPDSPAAYQSLTSAGFADAWALTQPSDPGFTWPLHLEDPYTSMATPTERIDLVLTKGSSVPLFAARFGNTSMFQTPSGLWPSDHAGVAAVIDTGAQAQ